MAARTSSGAHPYLFSPSNPFFQDNGRRNTFLEVPGMDFGRLVWIPAAAWSFSFIANTDPGLNKDDRSRGISLQHPSPALRAYLHTKGGLHRQGGLCLADPFEEAGRRERSWLLRGVDRNGRDPPLR